MTQFQQFVAGMSMSISPKVDNLPVTSALNIAKGDVIVEVGGFMVLATDANTTLKSVFVAIEVADNSSGANGDIGVLCVGSGQRVTVVTKTVLPPGASIAVSTTTPGAVQELTTTIDLKIGFYIGIEPGVYFKDIATPFAEGYTENAAPEVAAAVDEIVVVEIS